ncbi:tyrosine-protein kinase CSK-like isoform X2 [Anneissia japonica]|uniref:tyrosine-protein kinase CSK-like isoform X2 n=1 Tax=Anneissia japonica TaxID=1529436 RepID=UPI0014258853|nr:tyrosine-protein kinase CSK-like isoform X2 [Anneissia japonica]
MSDNNWVTRQPKVKVESMIWFHGKISREEAEQLLKPWRTGQYLVRESTHFPGDYTLCVCISGKVEHYHVIYKDRKLTIDEEGFFDDLTKLVEHYKDDADGLVSHLITPVPKKGYAFKEKGWAINRNEITVGKVLGSGQFGEVKEGEYKNKKVALKAMNESQRNLDPFLAEASIMTQLRHRNLVQLIGVALGNPVYIVLEFMAKGNLLDYLRSRGRAVVTKKQQLDFSKNIAAGMNYLETKKFIHRDLAARNILISEDDTAKVSDFGLAKDDTVTMDSGKIPVKWTAPEAVRKNQYSAKSDVWSFGVLLWELYSFGRVPYPRVPADNVIAYIEEGCRMQAPEDCPDHIYKIMEQCWYLNPERRPTFSRICDLLECLTPFFSS